MTLPTFTVGRVLHHLIAYGPYRRNAIIFTGFQAGGTRGAALGQTINVRVSAFIRVPVGRKHYESRRCHLVHRTARDPRA
ncbi:hypothetical protein [Rathayibacter soli]|uniref:hypothetical protein n=1 Tax=Rathayibacter soli TaxID=3144168 RepID=UPI0039080DAF